MNMHSSITFERIEEACRARETSLENPGFCIACGADHDECEPDARNYTCYECGQSEVFGAEECLMFL